MLSVLTLDVSQCGLLNLKTFIVQPCPDVELLYSTFWSAGYVYIVCIDTSEYRSTVVPISPPPPTIMSFPISAKKCQLLVVSPGVIVV